MQPVKRNRGSQSTNGLGQLGTDLKARMMEWDDRIRRTIEDIKYKLHHLPQTNFELGKTFADEGQVNDAIFRFRMATYFAPNFTAAWYNLGCCLIAKGQEAKATAALKRVLQLEPGHADAKFMLATIDPGLLAPQDRPQRMPLHMVETYFTKVAEQWDMMEGAHGYVAPQEFHRRVMAALTGRTLQRMLDLGCGTGLATMPFVKEVQERIGVDVTPAMADRARMARLEGAPVYHEVLTLDANQPHVALPQNPYDLVIALNVLPYLGECAAFMTHAAQALNAQGLFAVTAEPFVGNHGFGVVPQTSRFGHSVEYVRQVAQAAGLALVGQDTMPLHTDSKVFVLLFSRAK